VTSEADLLHQLQPGVDGLTLIAGRRRATLLPQVWEHLRRPDEFLSHLKRKAGLSENYWSATLRFERYRAVCVAEPQAAQTNYADTKDSP
jgi:AMMECR1 domain-containing protein